MSIPRTGKRQEKSVKLLPTELNSLTEIRENYNSFTRFSESFGIARTTLLRIMEVGSGSEPAVKRIRRKLNKLKTAA